LPRTVKDMALVLPQIPKNDVHSGDLVFLNTNGKSFPMSVFMSIMDKFVHAPSQRTGRVLVSSLKNHIGINTMSVHAVPKVLIN